MARNRMIQHTFWEDDKLADVSIVARHFFVGLWNFADDEGYLRCSHRWLKAKCFPYDDVDVESLLNELLGIGVVVIQNEVLHIKNFLKHQSINRPRPSNLINEFNANDTSDSDNSDGGLRSKTPKNDDTHGVLTEPSVNAHALKEIEIKEKKKEKEKKEKSVKKEKPANATHTPNPTHSIFDNWNTFAGKHGLGKVFPTTSRCLRLEHCLRQSEFDFKSILDKIKNSHFCLKNAQEKEGWRISFDWLVKKDDNWRKVIDGLYLDSQRPQGPSGGDMVSETKKAFDLAYANLAKEKEICK